MLKIVYCSPHIINLDYETVKHSNTQILWHTVFFLWFTSLLKRLRFYDSGINKKEKKRSANFYKAKPSADRYILKWQTLSFLSVIILDLFALSN